MKLRTDLLPAEQVYTIPRTNAVGARSRTARERRRRRDGSRAVGAGRGPRDRREPAAEALSRERVHVARADAPPEARRARRDRVRPGDPDDRGVPARAGRGATHEVVASAGVTWSELYRALGVVSLTVLLAALLGVPLVSAIDPVLLTSLALALFAAASAYQLWINRFSVLRQLRAGRSATLRLRRRG